MKWILVLSTFLVFCSCEKLPFIFGKNIPECIQEEIDAFEVEMNATCDTGAEVVSYDFQDKTVYAFYPADCFADYGVKILDEDCNELCVLGTLLGNEICEGVNFGENAEELKTIWKQ